MSMKLIRIMVQKQNLEINLEFAIFDIHIFSIVSSVSAQKLKCPSSARLGTFTARGCLSQKIPARTHLYYMQLQDQQVAFYDYSHAFLGDQLSSPCYNQMVIGTKKQNPYDKIKLRPKFYRNQLLNMDFMLNQPFQYFLTLKGIYQPNVRF